MGKASKTILDPVVAANKVANAADGDFLSVVIASIPVSDFLELDPPLKINIFKPLRLLALLDTLYDYKDAEILSKVDSIESMDALHRLRSHEHYPMMVEKVKEAVKSVSGLKTMDEAAKEMEPRVALSVVSTALSSKSARERLSAGGEVIGRRSAKKTRSTKTESTQNNLFVGQDVLKAFQAHQRLMSGGMRVGEFEGEGDEIDGSVINVPSGGRGK